MKKFTFLISAILSWCMCMAAITPHPQLNISSFNTEDNQSESKITSVVRERSSNETLNLVKSPQTRSLIEPPVGIEPQTYYLTSGEYFESTINGFMNATAYFNTIQVIIDKNDIYIAGLFTYEPSSWIKGTIEGDKAIFASSQQCSDKEGSPGWLCGSDNLEYYSQTIDFSYNKEEGLLAAITPWIVESASPVVMMAYGYWTNPVFTNKEPAAPQLVQVPEGLKTESFLLSANDYESDIAVYAPVNIGIDGDDVYIQGLSAYFPESWIKGTKKNNTITFEYGQYFGETGRYQFFLNKALKSNVIFQYSPSKNEYKCQNSWFFIDNGSNYFESFVNAVIVPISDVAAMPEDPMVYDVELLEEGMGITFEVSALDNQGQGLLVTKLFYEFYVDINGEVSPLVFPKVDYPELPEDMTEIPFGFTDNVNFFPNEIYIHNMDWQKWDKIGIRSIYKGGGETNVTEIQWRPLKMVTLPEDLILTPYQLSGYDPYYNITVTHNILLGYYGENEFYMKGFSEFFPNAVAKGTVTGDGVISIPETYIADATHILNGTSKVFLLPATILYDSTKDEYEWQGKLYTYSYVENTLFDELENTTFEFIPNVPAVPANPRIDKFVLYNEDAAFYDHQIEFVNMPYMHMTVPSYDLEGNPMIQEELYYMLWVEDSEGKVSPLVFDPDLYTYLPIELTLIPYTFTDYYEFKEKGSEIYLNQNKELIASWKKIGVQTVYFGGDEQNQSEIGWFNIEEYKDMIYEAAGIDSIEADPIDVRYYDLQGRAVKSDTKGAIVKQTTMSNGKVKTVKILNR